MWISIKCVVFSLFFLNITSAKYVRNGCYCFEDEVDCSNRNLTNLPNNIPVYVKILDLSNNKFTTIPNLANFLNLTILNISHNHLSTIDHEAFKTLSKLETLDLSYNGFTDWRDIMKAAFSPLKKLSYLDLSYNKFSETDFTKYIAIPSLEILKLINCSISSIEFILIDNKKLIELHVSKNKMRNINYTMQSTSLTYLDLSSCRINNISANAFTQLTSLNTVVLQNNRMRHINLLDSYFSLIDVSDCTLESIPTGNLKNLDKALFQGNRLSEIKKEHMQKLINFGVLSVLNLSSNALERIQSGSFDNLTCETIDLSFNKLTFLDKNLFRVQKELLHLNLTHNYLASIEYNINNLITLDLSFNEIMKIENPASLEGTPNLNELILTRNFITSIPDQLYAPNLENLIVNNCRIRFLTNETFNQMYSLRSLFINNNELTTANPTFFPKIFYVELYDNPWICDCPKLKAMFETLDSAQANRLICNSPGNVFGKTWYEACETEWYKYAKTDNKWWYSIAIIITMALVLIGVVLVKKINKAKKERERELAEERRQEEIESLRRMQRAQREAREEANRNAPDPRDLQRPPSYTEALLLPKLDASHPSLAGSLHSLASRQTLNSSNPDLSKRNRQRRKRRRRKSESSEGRRASSNTALDTDISDREFSSRREPIESDF